jgi:hypothetical protein
MAAKDFRRIPRVPRLEYLVELLRGVREGYNPEDVRRRAQRIRDDFEAEKARALGRQNPRTVSGAITVSEAEKMAVQMGLARRRGAQWSLTLDGEALLAHCPEDPRGFLGDDARRLLVPRIWQTYPRFGETLLTIRAQPDATIDLPMRSGKGAFREAIEDKYGLTYDLLTFIMVREMGTQLELLNWYVLEETTPRRQRVYLVADIVLLGEVAREPVATNSAGSRSPLWQDLASAAAGAVSDPDLVTPCDVGGLRATVRARGDIVVDAVGDCAVIRPRADVDLGAFEQALWEVYLRKVDFRLLIPALYPELRNEVCLRLKIPDRLFDRVLLDLIDHPRRLRIFPSGGELGYASNLAHLHKYLPPKTARGHFMVYLKVDRVT